MTSCTSLAPASDWAWAAACSTDSRAAPSESSAKRSTLASESCAKYANWLIAASLAALNWSILNMALILCLGVWLAAFAALHKLHFRPNPPEVKGFLVQRNINLPPLQDQSLRRLSALANNRLRAHFTAMPRSFRYRTAPGWNGIGEAPDAWFASSRKLASLWTRTSSSFFSKSVFVIW